MFREQLRQVFSFLKRTLRMEQRLTIQELLLLAEATVNYGLTIQASEKWSALPPPYVIITIPELAFRFTKTPQAINDILLLLRAMGRAEPLDCHGHWKLKLTDIASSYERVFETAPVKCGNVGVLPPDTLNRKTA